MKNTITVKRKTTESEIRVTIEKSALKSDYRKRIKTPIMFLNHMIEHIVWRSLLNIEIDLKLDEFTLVHLITEDLGMCLGKAIGEYVRENTPVGYGDAIGIIDESKTSVAISFEDRALFDFTSKIEIPAMAEDIPSEELLTFLDGFAQGARCTLHVDIEKGVNSHHIWESVFRGVGIALGRAISIDENRKGLTAGVAGKVTYEIE